MHPFIIIFLCAMLGLAVYTDLREQRIPNLLNLILALFGLLFNTFFGMAGGGAILTPWDGLLFALSGLGIGFALMLPPYLLGVMGGGDVKLMAAIGACLGWRLTVDAFLYASLAGGVYALTVLLLRHRAMLLRILRNFLTTLWLLSARGKAEYAPVRGAEALPRLCYGLAIAAGTGAAMLHAANGSGLLAGLF